jgi:uncharacterized protein involved in type VI secretion and phage assembly
VKPIVALPRIDVSINGEKLADEDLATLSEVRVRSALSVPAQCELTFLNAPTSFGAGSAPSPGLALEVRVRGVDAPLFTGEITALEFGYEPSGSRKLRLRGYDVLHRLRKRQPVRAHVQVTVADLARELLADDGVEVEANEPGPLWRRIFQARQSDFDLLVEVAARCGLYVAAREDSVHLMTLEGLDQTIDLTLGETLLEARIEVNSDASCRKVTAAAWDTSRIEPRAGEASTARSGREVEAEATAASVGGSDERIIANRTAQSGQHADALAQAELDLRIGAEVTFWGVADGDPNLMPGTRIKVDGVDDPVAGTYVLTAVTHTLDSFRGFVSEISTSPPILPRRTEGGLVGTLGIVADIADPEKLGRIRVSLPAMSDIESDWMGIVSAGGGQGKGLIMLPEVGDQVLVLAQGDDLTQGLVLGGLHGLKVPPDWGIEDGAVKSFGLFTLGGNKLKFDDGRKSIRLEDTTGSYVELAPGKVLIHANTDLELEAPGRAMKIRAATIDFERG